jgi:hypothetical protein
LRTFYHDLLQADFEGDDTFTNFTSVSAQLYLCDELIMEQMAPGSLAGTGNGR